jgi:tetratricopeptide (TPR) repeat protein
MPERTPLPGMPANDPEQLPLGEFEGAVLLPLAGPGRAETGDPDTPVAVREPPVCGEWSYDATDEADSRAGALLGASPPTLPPAAAAAAPTTPQRLVPPPAPPVRMLRTPLFNRSLTPPTPLPALAELKSIHEAHPGSAKTAIDLAHALDKRGNIEGALSALQRAIDAGADGVVLRCARARLLSGRLRYDDAEMELRRAAKLKPDDADVLLQQGILACRRAKWRDAVDPLEKVTRLDPLGAQAHFYLGEALNKLDRLTDALAAYQRAAQLEPENFRALKGVGIVFDRMGRPSDAAAFYRRARDAQGG